jgi:hypothetical protein
LPSTPKRQSGFVGSVHPCSVVGWHGLQRALSMQNGRFRSVLHSLSEAQARHSVVMASQIGVVGVAQSLDELAHPPHAPPAVQTRFPTQSSGVVEQGTQVIVALSQMGVFPLHPALPADGSHSTHFPPTHSWLPAAFAEQSVASRHSTQVGSLVPACTQSRSGPWPEHARFVAGSHTQVRLSQDLESVAGHALPQAAH